MDTVNHPPHYTAHPSGVEAIEICEHLGFNLGNAVKYLFRVGLKHENALEDLKKADWYFRRYLSRPRFSGFWPKAFYDAAMKVLAADKTSLLSTVLRTIVDGEEERALPRLEAEILTRCPASAPPPRTP